MEYRPQPPASDGVLMRRKPSDFLYRNVYTDSDGVIWFGVALPPCHTLWQCKVRTVVQPVAGNDLYPEAVRYLDLHLYQRSADCFLGVPFNIASYSLLLKLLAHTHNMDPGRFIHTFGDLHIYNNHREQVKVQQDRSPFPAPNVALPADLFGRGFDGMMQWAERVGTCALQKELSPETWPAVLKGYLCHASIKAEVAV